MNRRITIGILIAVAGIVVAALGVYAIRQVITQALAPPAMPTPQGPVTEQVVVVARDLEIGSLLAAEDVRAVAMPVELIPRNVLQNEQDVIGRITTVAMVDGEMVLRHHLADPTNISHDMAFVIGDDQVLMAFPATDLMSSLNVLQRGDLVDFLITIDKTVDIKEIDPDATEEDIILSSTTDEEKTGRKFTFDAMQAVEISAIIADITYEENQTLGPLVPESEVDSQEVASQQPASVKIKAYLLALSPQDALVMKHLLDSGANFDLVLRSASPPIYFDLDPVYEEYIVEKYELEVIK